MKAGRVSPVLLTPGDHLPPLCHLFREVPRWYVSETGDISPANEVVDC